MRDPHEAFKEKFNAEQKKKCSICHDTKKVKVERARTIGYTYPEGEIIDEHLEPCPDCTNL